MQNLCVLGATGSIGQSTLDVVRRHPDRFNIIALTANRQIDELVQQAVEFQPDYVVCANSDDYSQLTSRLAERGLSVKVLVGQEGLTTVASLPEVDTVMAAIVGAAGLAPTYAAACAGKKILLANKEALVMSGDLFMQAVTKHKALLLPVDSEHNAIFQCLPASFSEHRDWSQLGIANILLTGSGGPFLKTPIAELQHVTPEQACAHPNWDMGRKISVDSATMMNKGLEFIEAHWLFGVPKELIQVVIHPQSTIHSMVQYQDGSVLAQMGQSDMRIPIAHVMAFPERIDSGVAPLDFTSLASLEFLPPDFDRFPNLKLAIDAVEAGQWASTALNAANEISVAAFLDGRIAFLDIARINNQVLEKSTSYVLSNIDEVVAYDLQSRKLANQILEGL